MSDVEKEERKFLLVKVRDGQHVLSYPKMKVFVPRILEAIIL